MSKPVTRAPGKFTVRRGLAAARAMDAFRQTPTFPGPALDGGFAMPPSTQACRPNLFGTDSVSIFFDLQKPNCWPEHAHKEVQISIFSKNTLCEASTVTPTGKRRRQEIQGAQVCFIASNQPHACDWRREAELINLYIKPDFVRQVVADDFRDVVLEDFRNVTAQDCLICDLAQLLQRHCRQLGRCQRLYFETHAMTLTLHLLSVHLDAEAYVTVPRGQLPNTATKRVVDYIHDHLSEDISVFTLAKEARFSPQHFGRLFKKRFGMTPHRFILRQRVLHARELLLQGDHNIAEAAFATGFCDQSHLDRWFFAFLGCTPSAFRKLQR